MAYMYDNDEIYIRDYGGSLQSTNWILDSVAMCHMSPQFSDLFPGLLEDTDKYIEVADGNYIREKKKGQVQIRMLYYNGYPFIATFHNVLFAPDICNRLFFDYYINEFGKSFFISQRVLNGVIWR